MPSTYDLLLQRKAQLSGQPVGPTAQIPLQTGSSTSKVYEALLQRKQFIKEHPYVAPVAEIPQIANPQQQESSLPQKAGNFMSGVSQGVTSALSTAKNLIGNISKPNVDVKSILESFNPVKSAENATKSGIENVKKASSFTLDLVKGLLGEVSNPSPELIPGTIQGNKVFEPQNEAQKLGALGWALIANAGTGQASGINTAFEGFEQSALSAIKSSPKVAFVTNTFQKLASREVALFLNKIKPLNLTFEDLQAVTGAGGIKPTEQQLVKFNLAKKLSEDTGMSFADIIKAGEKESPKTKLYDFIANGIEKIKQTLKSTLSPKEQKFLTSGEKQLQTKTEDQILQEQVAQRINPVKVPSSDVLSINADTELATQGTPKADALAKTVLDTNLENTSKGKEIMKEVIQAKITGQDILPSQLDENKTVSVQSTRAQAIPNTKPKPIGIKTLPVTGKESKQIPTNPTNKQIPHKLGYSRLQERVQEQILQENGQRYDFNPDTATYNIKTLKGDAENALKLVNKDPEKAIRIAKGLEAPPADTTANNVSMAVALKARDEGNTQLFTELINKNSLRLTRFGQEIVMARGHFNDNSPVNFMKKVIDARMSNLGKSIITEAERKLGKTSSAKTKAVERIDRETNKLQERLIRDQAKIKMAQDIIDSLKCL